MHKGIVSLQGVSFEVSALWPRPMPATARSAASNRATTLRPPTSPAPP